MKNAHVLFLHTLQLTILLMAKEIIKPYKSINSYLIKIDTEKRRFTFFLFIWLPYILQKLGTMI